MIGLKGVGQNSGVATLIDYFGSSALLKSWIIFFMTWRDVPESSSGFWSQLSQTNVTEDEGWTFFGTNYHF